MKYLLIIHIFFMQRGVSFDGCMRLLSITKDAQEPVCIREADPEHRHIDSESPVLVLFTSTNATLKALEQADEPAKSLRSSIVLVAAQMVLFPSRIDKPPVSVEFLVEQLQKAASRTGDAIGAFISLCRDPLEALNQIPGISSPIF